MNSNTFNNDPSRHAGTSFAGGSTYFRTPQNFLSETYISYRLPQRRRWQLRPAHRRSKFQSYSQYRTAYTDYNTLQVRQSLRQDSTSDNSSPPGPQGSVGMRSSQAGVDLATRRGPPAGELPSILQTLTATGT